MKWWTSWCLHTFGHIHRSAEDLNAHQSGFVCSLLICKSVLKHTPHLCLITCRLTDVNIGGMGQISDYGNGCCYSLNFHNRPRTALVTGRLRLCRRRHLSGLALLARLLGAVMLTCRAHPLVCTIDILRIIWFPFFRKMEYKWFFWGGGNKWVSLIFMALGVNATSYYGVVLH